MLFCQRAFGVEDRASRIAVVHSLSLVFFKLQQCIDTSIYRNTDGYDMTLLYIYTYIGIFP